MKLVVDLTEYHLPRLTRADVAVVAQVEHSLPLEQLPTDELRRRLMRSLGIDAAGEIVEGELVEPQQPAWLAAVPAEDAE